MALSHKIQSMYFLFVILLKNDVGIFREEGRLLAGEG